MKDHLTDFETSKKLEAAGFTEFGRWVWITDQYKKRGIIEIDKFTALALRNKRHDYDPHVAYMLEELLEKVEGDWHNLEWFKGWGDGAFWFKTEKHELPFKADTRIQAVAQAIIWQKEQEKLK